MLRQFQNEKQEIKFKDESFDIFTYHPKKSQVESECFDNWQQTDELDEYDQETQVIIRKRHVNIQVNEQNLRQAQLVLQMQKQKETEIDHEQQNTKLVQFLKEQTPKMIEALYENTNSLYQIPDYIFEDQLENEIVNEPQLSNQIVLEKKQEHIQNEHQITGMNFNCNGFLLAVSVSLNQNQHLGGCSSNVHKGSIYIININKSQQQHIGMQNCINCVRFHPSKPNILLAGSVNGVVYLIDTAVEKVLAESKVDDYFHRESIIDILFFQQKYQNQQVYNLASISSDGKILVWDMKEFNKFITNHSGTVINNNNSTLSIDILNAPAKGYMLLKKRENQINYVGIQSVTQNEFNDQLIVIGSETGQLYRAFIKNITYQVDKSQKNMILNNVPKQLEYSEESLQLILNLIPKNILDIKLFVEQYCIKNQIKGKITPEIIFNSRPDPRKIFQNPMDFIFEQHLGPVHKVNFHPFMKSIFLSASYDGMFRIYDVYQNKSIINGTLEPEIINNAVWSRTRPSIIMLHSSDNRLRFYDLKDITQPFLTCFDNVVDFRVNHQLKEVISIAFNDFRIELMNLDPLLLEPIKNELEQTNKILNL